MAEELSLLEELFTYQNLIHAVSGATGGIVAITVFFPLNNIRMRVQVDGSAFKSEDPFEVGREIMKKDGFAALYQGWWSAVVSLGASNFVYFYVYNAFKTLYQVKVLGSKKKSIDAFPNLAIAAAAGVINVFSTTPLWVVGTRLAVQDKAGMEKKKEGEESKTEKSRQEPYKGILDCLIRITREEGFFSMWKGIGPSLILVSNPTVQFVAYEWLRKANAAFAKARGGEITSVEFFIIGAIAKAIATYGTYPLQVAQSKLRADRGHGHGPAKGGDAAKKEEKAEKTEKADKPIKEAETYTGTIDCLYKIWAKEGYIGWFKGLQAKLWQTVLTAAFQFLVYEKIAQYVTALFFPQGAVEAAKKAH